ncbi:catalase-like [Periplaneta americana]|uniref:catalase-like n=1 Tax=Periplaneta americana TaxID=6978 RepID=UPI0037E820D8
MEDLLPSCLISLLLCSGVWGRDPVEEQLMMYAETHNSSSMLETSFGAPLSDITSSLTVGPRGPILLQDIVFLDILAHFDRERIPERVVHAKGAGAFGYFNVTNDITKYTKAVVFDSIGKVTNISVRFSLVTYESGASDTRRDPRGFAIKFYTEDGIWDLIGLNSPVFFIRNPLLFSNFIHSQKRNPVTNIKDKDMYWDFISSRPETIFQVMNVFTDSGTPDGYRHMNGHGINAFKMVNATGEAVYVKFHYLTKLGVKNLNSKRAIELAGSEPDYATRDLYDAIALKNYPCWTLYIQVMTFQQAEQLSWNPFDATKIWPEEECPLIEVGTLTLNGNPRNYFADVEQIAFSPANLIPGIEPSPDKLLQGRLFAYSDTQRYRLGVNYLQIPVNCPFKKRVITDYQRNGLNTIHNQEGAPNYYPNSFNGPHNVPSAADSKFSVSGDVARYNSSDDDNFSQPAMFWENISYEQQNALVHNLSDDVSGASCGIQERVVNILYKVNQEFGTRVRKILQSTEMSEKCVCES